MQKSKPATPIITSHEKHEKSNNHNCNSTDSMHNRSNSNAMISKDRAIICVH